MGEYQYTVVLTKLKELFGKIRSMGVPNKVTIKWLESVGYKSSNDRSMIGVLQQILFIDDTGTPLEGWMQYRGADYKKTLGKYIVKGYSELFEMYPDANLKNKAELDNFFSTKTKGGEQVISKITSTFKTLCELAEFDVAFINSNQADSGNFVTDHNHSQSIDPDDRKLRLNPNLQIAIQIQISPDATPEQIEIIFANMAKYLFPQR